MNTRFSRFSLLQAMCAVAAGALISSAAYADTRVDFTGVVDSISAGYEIPGIELGDTLSGSLSFSTTVTDSQPLSWIGLYSGAVTRFSAAIGDKHYVMTNAGVPASEIVVLNNDFSAGLYRDSLYFRVGVAEAATPEVTRFLQLTFSVASATAPSALVSDALPAAPNLDAFSLHRGFITYFPPGASQGDNFSLSTVSVTPVPEPQGRTMLLGGLAVMVGATLRQRRRARQEEK